MRKTEKRGWALCLENEKTEKEETIKYSGKVHGGNEIPISKSI